MLLQTSKASQVTVGSVGSVLADVSVVCRPTCRWCVGGVSTDALADVLADASVGSDSLPLPRSGEIASTGKATGNNVDTLKMTVPCCLEVFHLSCYLFKLLVSLHEATTLCRGKLIVSSVASTPRDFHGEKNHSLNPLPL